MSVKLSVRDTVSFESLFALFELMEYDMVWFEVLREKYVQNNNTSSVEEHLQAEKFRRQHQNQ